MSEFYSRDFLFAPNRGKGHYEVKAYNQESCSTGEKHPVVSVYLARYGEYISFVSGLKDLEHLKKFAKDLLEAVEYARFLDKKKDELRKLELMANGY